MVRAILAEVDRALGRPDNTSRALIRFVKDRPGHDFRYAINPAHIHQELGWSPQTSLQEGLRQTVAWYLAHQDWCQEARARKQRFEDLWYGARLSNAKEPDA